MVLDFILVLQSLHPVFAQVTPLEGAIKQRQLQWGHSADEVDAQGLLVGFSTDKKC